MKTQVESYLYHEGSPVTYYILVPRLKVKDQNTGLYIDEKFEENKKIYLTAENLKRIEVLAEAGPINNTVKVIYKKKAAGPSRSDAMHAAEKGLFLLTKEGHTAQDYTYKDSKKLILVTMSEKKPTDWSESIKEIGGEGFTKVKNPLNMTTIQAKDMPYVLNYFNAYCIFIGKLAVKNPIDAQKILRKMDIILEVMKKLPDSERRNRNLVNTLKLLSTTSDSDIKKKLLEFNVQTDRKSNVNVDSTDGQSRVSIKTDSQSLSNFSVASAQSAKSAKSAQTAQSAKSAKSAKSAQTAQSSKSAQTAQSSKSAQTAKPAKPAKSTVRQDQYADLWYANSSI